MARVPIEIAVAGGTNVAAVSSAIVLANNEQNEFVFSQVDDFSFHMNMYTYKAAQANELLDQIARLKPEFRGFHPFVIAVVDAYLDGQEYANLFGSHRADAGIAVVTTANVPDLIVPRGRMMAYFIYYFARYSLIFLATHHRNHDSSRGCVFDRKVAKTDLTHSMRTRALCDECRRSLVTGDGGLSPRQFVALDQLFALSGRILTDGLERDGRARIFVGPHRKVLTSRTRFKNCWQTSAPSSSGIREPSSVWASRRWKPWRLLYQSITTEYSSSPLTTS